MDIYFSFANGMFYIRALVGLVPHYGFDSWIIRVLLRLFLHTHLHIFQYRYVPGPQVILFVLFACFWEEGDLLSITVGWEDGSSQNLGDNYLYLYGGKTEKEQTQIDRTG